MKANDAVQLNDTDAEYFLVEATKFLSSGKRRGLLHIFLFVAFYSFFMATLFSGLTNHEKALFQYRNSNWENLSVPESYIKHATVSDKGILWLGSNDGIVRYEAASESTFDRTQIGIGTEPAFRGLRIDGENVWTLFDERIFHFNGTAWQEVEIPSHLQGKIVTLVTAAQGKLWVRVNAAQVFEYDQGAWREFPIADAREKCGKYRPRLRALRDGSLLVKCRKSLWRWSTGTLTEIETSDFPLRRATVLNSDNQTVWLYRAPRSVLGYSFSGKVARIDLSTNEFKEISVGKSGFGKSQLIAAGISPSGTLQVLTENTLFEMVQNELKLIANLPELPGQYTNKAILLAGTGGTFWLQVNELNKLEKLTGLSGGTLMLLELLLFLGVVAYFFISPMRKGRKAQAEFAQKLVEKHSHIYHIDRAAADRRGAMMVKEGLGKEQLKWLMAHGLEIFVALGATIVSPLLLHLGISGDVVLMLVFIAITMVVGRGRKKLAKAHLSGKYDEVTQDTDAALKVLGAEEIARTYLRSGEYEKCLLLMRDEIAQVLFRGKPRSRVSSVLGISMLDLGDYFRCYSMALLAKGDYDAAEQVIRDSFAISINGKAKSSNLYEAPGTIAESYLSRGHKIGDALEHVDAALAIRKRIFRNKRMVQINCRNDYSLLTSLRAWALAALNRPDEAEQVIADAISSAGKQNKPQLAKVNYRSGLAVLLNGQADLAREYLERAQELDPEGVIGEKAQEKLKESWRQV